jgi:hypothetical protein
MTSEEAEGVPMYRAIDDSNAPEVVQANKEKARAALENFVPPGYEAAGPALAQDGTLHIAFDLPAQVVRDEAGRILQAMGMGPDIGEAETLSLNSTPGVRFAVKPVLETSCQLVISGILGGSHAETGIHFDAALTLLQRLQGRLPRIEAEAALVPAPHYAPVPQDESWLLDIGGALALLRSAGYEVLTKHPAPDGFDVQIRRTFHDAKSFIAFARATALPAPAPRAREQKPAIRNAIATRTERRQRPWVLIGIALLALAALFFYPWQQ